MSVSDNFKRVQEDVWNASVKAGRACQDVQIITVTKTQSAETINEAISAGASIIGENRVQEFLEKKDALLPVEKHIIGQLQSNKVKYIIDEVQLIHSVDRESLLVEIDRVAAKKGLVMPILIEINIAGEKDKGGASLESLLDLLNFAGCLKNVSIDGLMAVPPICTGDAARKYFSKLRKLSENAKQQFPNYPLNELSMGMSGDYIEAIYEGATYVRIGSAIFGSRK